MTPKILIIDGHYKQSFYSGLLSQTTVDWLFITSQAAVNNVPVETDLVITNDELWCFNAATISELRRRKIPTLYLIDGIPEWRHIWENPRSFSEDDGMPYLQPVLCDKIACLGKSQARILESWGNPGKCEITGSPRFDALSGSKPRQRKTSEPYRILVTTATTPGFTEKQIKNAKEGLLDLKNRFENNSVIESVKIEPVWRLTEGLEKELRVGNNLHELTGKDLATQLKTVDAMITTPSTSMLEGMLHGLPVALLDYNNCPHYIPAAWTITASQHINETLKGLIFPHPARMLYQDTILHDALECRTPATPRVMKLIHTMVEIGRTARHENKPLEFPQRILRDEQNGYHLPEERFHLRTLYPQHSVFSQMNVIELQTEVANLRKIIKFRPSQIVYRGLAELQRILGLHKSNRR